MPDRMRTHLDLVRANYGRRQEIQGELRQIDEAATTDNRARNETEEARWADLVTELEAVDSRITSNLDIQSRSTDIEDGMAGLLGQLVDRQSGEVTDTRSLGERFIGSEGLDQWRSAGARGSYAMDFPGESIRAVTNITTGGTSAGALTQPDHLARVGQNFLDRRTFLADLLPHVSTNQGQVEYVQDQTPLADLANAAVEVAEAAAKPQAGPTLAVVTEPIATIAAWVNMTRQAASDVPQIQSWIDGRLRYSLRRRLDAQAINGDGTGATLKGLLNRTGIVTYAPVAAEARYRTIRRAIRLGEDAEAVYEIIVLNPSDAEVFDLTNADTQGLHAVMDVAGAGARTAWGMRQVRSTAIAAGTAMLIDPMSLAIFDRQAPTAYMTDSHASNFTSNILTLLLELRAGLALFDSVGVAKITFNGAA